MCERIEPLLGVDPRGVGWGAFFGKDGRGERLKKIPIFKESTSQGVEATDTARKTKPSQVSENKQES